MNSRRWGPPSGWPTPTPWRRRRQPRPRPWNVPNPGAVDDEPGSGVNFHTRPLYNLAQTRQGRNLRRRHLRLRAGLRYVCRRQRPGRRARPSMKPVRLPGSRQSAGRRRRRGSGRRLQPRRIHRRHRPDSFSSKPQVRQITQLPNGVQIRFPTVAGRTYRVWYRNHSLDSPPGVWTQAPGVQIAGTGGVVTWVDDGSATSPSP
ncbi:MAG: hypothetical protein U1F87_18605 [Kiritimatiellia bacterium]